MENKRNAPLEILIAITRVGKGEVVRKILSKSREQHHMFFSAKGSTNASDIAELFGFGIRESEIVVGLIKPENADDLIDEIARKLSLHVSTNGLVMTVPIESTVSSTLKMLNIK